MRNVMPVELEDGKLLPDTHLLVNPMSLRLKATSGPGCLRKIEVVAWVGQKPTQRTASGLDPGHSLAEFARTRHFRWKADSR